MRKALFFGLALVSLLGPALGAARAQPGLSNPGASAFSFTFSFDENGNGFLSSPFFTGPIVGTLTPDNSGSGLPTSLTYILPLPDSALMQNGDLLVFDATNQLGDVVRFTDQLGDLNGATADRLRVYSDTPPSDSLADTPFAPLNTGTGLNNAAIAEVGPEGSNGADYVTGLPAVSRNEYLFTSDQSTVPEIDAGLMASACTVLAGGVLMLRGRRRRS